MAGLKSTGQILWHCFNVGFGRVTSQLGTASEALPVLIVCTQEELVVCRAPGRLDVMGGIADYSGSLVLQV